MTKPMLMVNIIGSKELVAKMERAGAQADRAADAGRYNVGLAILAAAVPITPKKWGVLRGSGYVGHPKNGSVDVGFGGPARAYAWAQHENMTWNHAVGGPKYLEKAVYQVAPRAAAIFGRIVEKALIEGGPIPPIGGAPATPNEGPRPPRTRRRKRRRSAK